MSYTTLKHKEVRIKKSRKCEFCGHIHEVGDKMISQAGVLDGDFGSYYMCLPCNNYIGSNITDIIDCGEIQTDFVSDRDYINYKKAYYGTTNNIM